MTENNLNFIYSYVADLKSNDYEYKLHEALMFRNSLKKLDGEINQNLKCLIDAANTTYDTNDHDEWLFHNAVGFLAGSAIGGTIGYFIAPASLEALNLSSEASLLFTSISGLVFSTIGIKISNYNAELILFIGDAYTCTNSMEHI